ncbi:PEGA domain-containing protein [Pyxidicoccus xibeiensis]|uniref:PEGA domain-containing protein n=1 Tax=Pyxidicoccus xibeiensis TaxID=2906759 RepID=UPI0020A7FC51|nr:PEGA domain-containing protein [Pyxidicoccus xibeiensis]MCP3142091.1 PEGA domain-containing protein [Pyxidicoccus xibeiensis]
MRGAWLAAVVVAVSGCARRQEPESVTRARALMEGAEQTSGNLALRCEPEDADVYLDGVLQGQCSDFTGSPKGLRVGVGLHHVEVKKQGFWPYTTYYEASGARARLTIQLRPMPAPGGGAP